MKRDMDLVREILLDAESLEHGYVNGVLKIDGYTEDQIGHHVYLMEQAGLVEAADASSMDSDSPIALLISIKWQGHDFLDSVRDPEIWKQTKDIAERAGGYSIALLGDLAKGLIKTQIKRITGVDV
ncbi:MAG: DUF2513 domain-containing protein [Chitinophagaceae bacterium]|nr:MAG: DUF2513 domain-containing protein [Chitinophagaceae bacterium]